MSTLSPTTVAHLALLGVNILRSKKLLWFQSTIGSSLTSAGRELLENYSGIPSEEMETHIYGKRDVVWEIFLWTCIGEFWFISLGLSLRFYYSTLLARLTKSSPPLPNDTATTEHDESLRLLDLGSCLGQDLRKLLHDGVPIFSLYCSDVFAEYENVDHALFRDASVFTEGHFIAADLLDADSTGNQLESTEGTWDVIAISMFLHIWDLKTQGEACKRILKLLKRREGSLVIGSQTGNEQPHESPLKPPFIAEGKERSLYRHYLDSFRRMWMDVGDEVGMRLDVQVDYAKQEGTHELVGEGAVEKGKQKFFMGAQERRLVFVVKVLSK